MSKSKTGCQWCLRLYASAREYSNHFTTIHTKKDLRRLQNPKSQKCYLSNVNDMEGLTDKLDIVLRMLILAPDYSNNLLELVSKRFNMEAHEFSDVQKSNKDDLEADTPNSLSLIHADQPIQTYLFSEKNANFDFHAPFCHLIAYQLAHFFSSAMTSQENIDKFFKDCIFKGLNPTHDVQFHSTYTICKLVNTAVDEPTWHSDIVNYLLLKGVYFQWHNIMLAGKYLLNQQAYKMAIVQGPHKEYEKGGNGVYGNIHIVTWQEEN